MPFKQTKHKNPSNTSDEIYFAPKDLVINKYNLKSF